MPLASIPFVVSAATIPSRLEWLLDSWLWWQASHFCHSSSPGALLGEYAWGELSDVLASGIATLADHGEMVLDYGSLDLPTILRGLDETEAGQLIQLARGSGGADALSQAMPRLSEIVDSNEDINAIIQKIGSQGMADLSGPLQAQRSGDLLELRAALSELSDRGRGMPVSRLCFG